MSLREHLAKSHEEAASHHHAMAARHHHLSTLYGGMAKAAGKPDGDTYSMISDDHGAMANIHKEHAAFHSGMAEACAKAVEDQLSKTLMPDRISSIAPPDDRAFGIRAVVRPGQPENVGAFDKSSISPNFRHLVENLADEI